MNKLSQDITESLLGVMLQLVSILSYRFVLWLEGSIQMWPHCRLKIAYCYCLRTWIFGRTPWIDTDRTFTIRTPLLMGHDAHVGVGMNAGHPQSSPVAAVVVVCMNREDVSGQSTDQTLRRYVKLLYALHSAVMRWRLVADWPSIGAFQWPSLWSPCEFGVSCWAGHMWDVLSCAILSDLWAPR